MFYMAAALSFLMDSVFEKPDHFNPFQDFMILMISPMLGFHFTRKSFRYLNEDSYTQMLYYYRMIPVPPEAVIVSRAIIGLGAFALNGLLFFGITYAIAGNMRASMNLTAYISFGLTWIGIGILVNGLYIYWEYMKSGKAYFGYTMLFNALIAAVLILQFLAGVRFSLMEYVADTSLRQGLLSPLMWGALVLGLTVFILMCRLTLRRMQTRDLS